MGYVLDGSGVDGQAIHHSDSRQVLNLDGGSAEVDGRAVVDDDEADLDGKLWLHGDQDGMAGCVLDEGWRSRSNGPDGVVWYWQVLAVPYRRVVYAACDSTTR